MKTQILAQIKLDYLSGVEKLKEDEYLTEDGMVFCKKCNTSRIYVLPDGIHAMFFRCECMQKQYREEKERQQREEFLEDYYKRKHIAQVPERFKNVRFKNSQITANNLKAYNIARNYLKDSQQMHKDNKGLYIYGPVGVGKTHLATCLCNELLLQGWSCLFTTITELLSELHKSYTVQGQVDGHILKRLKRIDFLFIDDFGKEFIGREDGQAKYDKMLERQVITIINARYNSNKPTIITSNYSKNALINELKLDASIADKVNEMATRIIRMSGENFRIINQETKSAQMRNVGV